MSSIFVMAMLSLGGRSRGQQPFTAIDALLDVIRPPADLAQFVFRFALQVFHVESHAHAVREAGLLPLTQPVIEELMRFREHTNFLIFCSTTSRSTPFDASKAWRKALVESGIGHCRFHDLRHTAASNLVRAGRSFFEVGTLQGHSSTQMTHRYSHLAIDDTPING